ncbi:ABC transporter substrate-binding protein [Phytoactinopolyspora halotolerans]|uniref:Extracellular solute-binding protein n=1 Tax=Phytoactinopolyspora halotolerans TaxID=1981512 RepID=A0A6L9SEB4_9ACTN|nr:substrate-binding domain-containing protein [Phytoactinopolyspora halotolerans]NEE03389.1 extracellular solute-binding protein [Phytoactinopolyspora halotolerans]
MTTTHRSSRAEFAADTTLSRRRFLRASAAAGLSVPAMGMLSACGEDSDDGPSAGGSGGSSSTLRVIHLPWMENVAPWLPDLGTQFEENNTGVSVDVSPLASAEGNPQALIQKFTLESRKDEPSFDVLLGPTPFSLAAPLAKAEVIAPIGDLIPDDILSRMPDSILSEVTGPDGNIWCFPFWQDVMGFLYNKTLMSEVGLDQPPATWEELHAQAQSIAPELPKDTYAYGADWNWVTRMFLPMLVTMTDTPYAENGTPNVADPAALEALRMLKDLGQASPPNSTTELASAEVFQAGKVVMETYWQPQYLRAQEAGLGEDELGFSGNLGGQRNSTVFWSTVALIPANSKNAELAVKFVTDGFLSDDGIQQSIEDAGRFLPLNDIEDRFPDWMKPLYQQMLEGSPLPLNDSFVTVVKDTFQTEAERMVIEDQSPEDTQQKLIDAFSAYAW